jgi:TRAP-type mannitol/chloroaromatic compound transport system permease large subunit
MFMAFLANNLAPLMFIGLVVFLLSGFPITFSLATNGLLFAAIGIAVGVLNPNLMQALPSRIYTILTNDTLLAIPFFTFMGLILERSGMAEDLLETIGQLFGPVRGGLAYAVILVGALLAATTGVVAASVISMGLISLPLMLKYGYDKRVASGVIAASGTLAQIIPPSLVLIILGSQLNVSVGDLYNAAFKPGFMLVGMYLLYVLLVSVFKPTWVPALPLSARIFAKTNHGQSGGMSLLLMTLTATILTLVFYYLSTQSVSPTHLLWGADTVDLSRSRSLLVAVAVGVAAVYIGALLNKSFHLGLLSDMAQRVIFVMVPPLALVFLVLGTVLLGIATPTEGGAFGAVGAIVLALFKKRIDLPKMKQAMSSTTQLTSFVLMILIGSTVFNLVFQGIHGPEWVEHLLAGIPGGTIGFLIAINLLIFVLAFFLEFFELSFILVPLIAPVAHKMGIDLVWLGVLLAVNMQTSFMHPPFGFALFYLRSVAPPEVKTKDIYLGAIPFVMIQVVMVGLIIAFPNMISTPNGANKVGATSAVQSGQATQTVELSTPLSQKPVVPTNTTPAKPADKTKPQFDFIPSN